MAARHKAGKAVGSCAGHAHFGDTIPAEPVLCPPPLLGQHHLPLSRSPPNFCCFRVLLNVGDINLFFPKLEINDSMGIHDPAQSQGELQHLQESN